MICVSTWIVHCLSIDQVVCSLLCSVIIARNEYSIWIIIMSELIFDTYHSNMYNNHYSCTHIRLKYHHHPNYLPLGEFVIEKERNWSESMCIATEDKDTQRQLMVHHCAILHTSIGCSVWSLSPKTLTCAPERHTAEWYNISVTCTRRSQHYHLLHNNIYPT